jgi:16S rRNA (guanine527-N7)-methyltransferase
MGNWIETDRSGDGSEGGGNLGSATIATLLEPYLAGCDTVPENLFEQLAAYLRLLLKWNSRTNLSAIREPGEMVRRHFGESLFAARQLGECATVLDFGSGAGFPGLPMQLLRPELRVTLAESQNKKAAFLREAVRTLRVNTEVWGDRVAAMPAERRFDVVALRAVDRMDAAIEEAAARVQIAAGNWVGERSGTTAGGWGRGPGRMLLMSTVRQAVPEVPGFRAVSTTAIPGSDGQQIIVLAGGL